jgi:hypothetical protein
MKLPTTQSIKPPISANNDGSGSSSPVKNKQAVPLDANKTVNAKSLDQLSNTWAKVKSSQPLSSEQVNKVISQSNESPINQAANKSPLSQQLSQLANQLEEQAGSKQTALADLKLFLIKLETQQGLLSLLSQQSFPKGNNVLITLDSKGAWQLQSPSQGFSLSNLTAQFSGNQSAPPPLNLSAITDALKGLMQALPTKPDALSQTGLRDTNGRQGTGNTITNATGIQDIQASTRQALSKLISIPPSMLESGKTIDLTAVQNAFKHSGQTLESQLAQLVNKSGSQGASQTISQTLSSTQKNDGTNTTKAAPDFMGRFKQVEQQVNQWVKQLAAEVKPSKTEGSTAEALKATLSTSNATALSTTLSTSEKTMGASERPSLLPNHNASTTISNSDNKSWLIKNQNALITQLSQTMLKNNSFIPNWANAGAFKNAGELNALFNLLLAPKQDGQSPGQSIWPNNLSAQSQINQTLQLLLTHSPDAEKDSAQNQLLRQIFNVNQSLMKMQHDQIHNRLGQQQADSPTQLQMSIPYAHQEHIQWADLELKEFQTENDQAEKTTGWHLILRFEQDTSQAFAVETQLKQDQLSVVLWATEKIQLKRLNQDIQLFKEKLNHAGFKLESITSKHGSPNKIQKPIQQSLVDVHT